MRLFLTLLAAASESEALTLAVSCELAALHFLDERVSSSPASSPLQVLFGPIRAAPTLMSSIVLNLFLSHTRLVRPTRKGQECGVNQLVVQSIKTLTV